MNDYRVYTYSKEDGRNEFLFGADSIQDILDHMKWNYPGLEIIGISKVGYLER